MQKKFALLQFSSTMEEIDAPAFIKKLPKNLWDRYRKTKNPFLYVDSTLYGEEGYTIFLPMLQEEKENVILEYLVKDVLDSFDDIGFTWGHDFLCPFVPEQYKPIPPELTKCILMPFVIKKCMKTINIPLQNAEICIIDHDPFLTETLLLSIYPFVNHLGLYTKNKEPYENTMEDIYFDNGLNVEVFYTPSLLQQYDMVIDTGSEELHPYQYKKNGIFFGVNNIHTDLDIKRNDLWILDSFSLTDGEQILSMAEFLLYISLAVSLGSLKNLPALIQEVWGIIKNHKMNISSYYRLGNISKPPNI